MNKIWIKRAVAVVVFLISIFVIDLILNRDNSEITTEMPKATLPIVSVLAEDHKINTMYGYTSRREEAYTKDSITPIPEDRKITLIVDTYQADIASVGYEVRSIDGKRLIEGGDITVLQKMPDQIRFSIQLKDLTDENTEYAFVTILTLEDGERVYYYTRFIQSEKYYEKEKLDFITFFHENTFTGDGSEIKKYLESSSKGDNSNFHKVTIHSNLNQVMWDSLEVEKVEEPQIFIKDITNQTASVVLQYLVKEGRGGKEKYYFVKEYYRVRHTPNRMYLLDYERTMDEIFGAGKESFSNDKINLGITGELVPMVESEGGKNLAFINANRLYVYSNTESKLSEVFSFYNKYNFDNVLLLYGGKQDFGAMKEVMERMVLTSEDPLYSKPTVVFNNFSGLSSNTITYENREQYVNVLKQARDGLTDGFYKIEFDYTKLNAQVNKVIITKL